VLIKPISRQYKAKALTNPFPSYVSLVKAGANQRPIRAIKMAGFKAEEISDMKIQRADAKIAAIVSTGFDLVSLKFDSAQFSDEDAVKAWLDAGGYEDYQIVATKSGFEVINGDARVETGTAQMVRADEGVSAFIARTHVTQESGAAQTNDASSGADVVDATVSKGEGEAEGTADATAEDGKGGKIGDALLNSPGHTEVIFDDEAVIARAQSDSGITPEDWAKLSDAVREESIAKAREALEAEQAAVATEQPVAGEGDGGETVEKTEETAETPNPDAELLSQATAKLDELRATFKLETTAKRTSMYVIGYIADAITTMGYLLQESDWNGLSPEVEQSLKNAARECLAAFLQASTDVAATYQDALDLVEDNDGAAGGAVVKTEETPAAPQVDMAAIGEMIATAVKDAIAPVTGAVAEVSQKMAEVSETVATVKTDLDARVDALETRGQARKGEVTPPVVERSQEEKPPVKAHRGMLAALGSRRANEA
jgi:hypothetical protein